MTNDIVTSPEVPVDQGIVTNARDFSNAMTQELNDDEIKAAFEMIVKITRKWQGQWVNKVWYTEEEALIELEKYEDELKYELATRMKIFVAVDGTPIFDGKAPIVEIVGAAPDHHIHKYGFDHEKKVWEVTKASQKDEAYLGEKGEPLKRRKK